MFEKEVIFYVFEVDSFDVKVLFNNIKSLVIGYFWVVLVVFVFIVFVVMMYIVIWFFVFEVSVVIFVDLEEDLICNVFY